MRSNKTKVSLFLLVIYILFLVGYGITLLAPIIPPYKTQIPAFLNLAFGAFFVLLFLFLILFVLTYKRNRILLLFHIVLILLTSDYILTYAPINLFTKDMGKGDIRIMTYNVGQFENSKDPDSAPNAIGVIMEYKPDVIAIQEMKKLGSNESSMRWLRKYFQKSEYPYIRINDERKLALISKYPISHSERIEYDSETNGSMMYILEIDHQKILLINNHLESYRLSPNEKQKYKGFVKKLNPKRFLGQVMEVKARLVPSMNARARAVKVIDSYINEKIELYNPSCTIVLGDFNDTPMSFAYHTLVTNRKDAYKEIGMGPGFSYNERGLPFRIDHVLYEGNLRAIWGEIPSSAFASDHNPLVIDFDFTNK